MTTYKAEIFETPLNLYRIFYSDGNDIDEEGRVSAHNIDDATEYAINQYLNTEIERDQLIWSEDGDDEHQYLMLNVCLDCPYHDKTDRQKQRLYREFNGEKIKLNEIESICEYCDQSAYLEIRLDNDVEPSFRTIYGTNEYANLEENIKPVVVDQRLNKAWSMDPQLGADMLMLRTIEDNPKLFSAIDKEYLKRLFETNKKVNEK